MDILLLSLKTENEKAYAQECYNTAKVHRSLQYVSRRGLTDNRALEIRHLVLAIVKGIN